MRDDCKRVSVIEAANSSCMSKKRRRILHSSDSELLLSERCFWLNSFSENTTSLSHLENSVSGDASCTSSNDCEDTDTTSVKFKDLLQNKSFETVDSICPNGIRLRESTPTSDSNEMESPTEKQKPVDRPMKSSSSSSPPPISEIEDFFAEAEKYEQKRFSEKYNFDIVMDVPLEGRYQWIPLKP